MKIEPAQHRRRRTARRGLRAEPTRNENGRIEGELSELYETHPEVLVRRDWLEGRIAFGENHLSEAGELLERTRQAFLRQKSGYDAALVYLKQGCTAQIKALAHEIITLFEALQVNREAIAAMLVFQKAPAQEKATVEIVRRVTAQLERLQASPGRRFERPS